MLIILRIAPITSRKHGKELVIINIKKTFPKIAQLNDKGRIFDNPKDIAGKVNEFFVNIGPDTELEIPIVPNVNLT